MNVFLLLLLICFFLNPTIVEISGGSDQSWKVVFNTIEGINTGSTEVEV